ncbi:MBL fold metallo-hydrolase [Alkalihalobacillus oceani]|uniref:MBL fold metallo-hydrolase n=1 Tax=Halalkalibacter oceani TaxID=1653776 RepID=A0A9X2DNA6_9BACI|nr:MBL fold metallo-hydrolase [Halalkalibacter oceani]MCM3713849.1 MBL fold metallo-hydrolase [Halalkalibacter oceani]
MNVTFLGGVNEYGRSCFHLQMNQISLLVDCGIMKNETHAAKRYPLLTKELAENLDAVFLTHSHEDHTAALPHLYQLGFKGKIYATAATINETSRLFTPVCTRVVALDSFPRRRWLPFSADTSLEFQYGYSGHTLGSIWFLFRLNGAQIFFSGDYSTESPVFIAEEPIIDQPVDIAILDGAYGKETKAQHTYLNEIYRTIDQALREKKKVLLHGPTYGKLQDLLIYFQQYRTDFLERTVISPEIAASFERYAQYPCNLKEPTLSNFAALSKQVRTTPLPAWLNDDEHSIGFVTEQELLHQFAAQRKENLLILCTGPFLQDILSLTDAVETTDYVQKRYKVHPGAAELRAQVQQLRPRKIIFSHSPNEKIKELQKWFSALGEEVELACVGEKLRL